MALSLQQTILARFTAGSNEVFLLLRWGIWVDGYLFSLHESNLEDPQIVIPVDVR